MNNYAQTKPNQTLEIHSLAMEKFCQLQLSTLHRTQKFCVCPVTSNNRTKNLLGMACYTIIRE